MPMILRLASSKPSRTGSKVRPGQRHPAPCAGLFRLLPYRLSMLHGRPRTEPLLHPALQNGVLSVVALHGPGGVGKTSLAAALAHSSAVQRRFKDGVLWATLGQNPDCLSLLTEWIRSLGDLEYRPTTVSA